MALARSISAVEVVIICALLSSGVIQALGRKCVCTSTACKESGAKTCRTRYFCYTELIYSNDAGGGAASAAGTKAVIKTTRGCTEGATPLLCESKSLRSSDEDGTSNSLELLDRTAWPRLTCCDSHDYCNAADEDFESTPNNRQPIGNATDGKIIADRVLRDREYAHGLSAVVAGNPGDGQQNVQPLHVAALVLAVAALVSVFAACYVVTRFFNANGTTGGGVNGAGSCLPSRLISHYGNRLDF